MEKILEIMLGFTNKSYSVPYRIVSMIPGTIVFLIISPFVLFFPARFLGQLVPLTFSSTVEMVVMVIACTVAMLLMHWALYVLWVDGDGTPAPIAPTKALVKKGPYRFLRNPVELGTDFYFFVLGTWFDSLVTGFFCMIFGMILGLAYIKIIEEKELALRFGDEYELYKDRTPCMFPWIPKG